MKTTDFRKTKAELIAELEQLRRGGSGGGDAPGAGNFSAAGLFEILQNAEDAIISIDENFHIKVFNRGAEKIFGYTAEEILDKPLDLLIPDSGKEAHRRHIRQFAESGDLSRRIGERPAVFDVRKDGEEFPAEVSITKNEAQGKRFFTAFLRETTERTKAEEALRESEGRLRFLTNSVPVLISYIDADQRFRFSSRTHAQWLASPEEGLFGRRVDEFLAPEAYRTLLPYIERALAGEEMDFEVSLPYPDGKNRTVHIVYIPDLGPSGEVRGYSSMAEDITERRQNEEALRAGERLLRTVFDTLPVAVAVKDRDGRYLQVNREWCAVTGVAAGAAIGRTGKEVLPWTEAERKEIVDEDRAVLRGGEPLIITEQSRHDGKRAEAVFNTRKAPL